jgi:hypothetical protein
LDLDLRLVISVQSKFSKHSFNFQFLYHFLIHQNESQDLTYAMFSGVFKGPKSPNYTSNNSWIQTIPKPETQNQSQFVLFLASKTTKFHFVILVSLGLPTSKILESFWESDFGPPKFPYYLGNGGVSKWATFRFPFPLIFNSNYAFLVPIQLHYLL